MIKLFIILTKLYQYLYYCNSYFLFNMLYVTLNIYRTFYFIYRSLNYACASLSNVDSNKLSEKCGMRIKEDYS